MFKCLDRQGNFSKHDADHDRIFSMTLGLLFRCDDGLVLVSDTRTNAGVDAMATTRKIHSWYREDEIAIFVQFAGNLATMAACTAQFTSLFEAEEDFPSMFQVARRFGQLLKSSGETHDHPATCLVSGRIRDGEPAGFLVYPEGNFIETTIDTPFFQIGEGKYGKPLLVMGFDESSSLTSTLRLALCSFDLTFKCNLSVGLPIDYILYPNGKLTKPKIETLEDLPFDVKISEHIRKYFDQEYSDIRNPSVSSRGTDFFDTLRELDDVLTNLKELIRGINDPESIAPNVNAARAYVESFQVFLDVRGSHPPENLPTEIRSGLISALKRVNWEKVSEQAQKWVSRIIEIVTKL